MILVEFLAIKRHGRFEPERVAASKTCRDQSVSLTGFHDGLKEGNTFLCLAVDLEPVFSGVTGAGNEGVDACHIHVLHSVVVLEFVQWILTDLLEDPLGVGALEGDFRNLRREVFDGHVFEVLGCSGCPLVNLVDVPRVHYQEVLPALQADDHHVVYHAAVWIAHGAVNDPAGVPFGDVIGHKELQEVEGIRTLYQDLSHVGDVPESGLFPACGVLFLDARELDRKSPP